MKWQQDLYLVSISMIPMEEQNIYLFFLDNDRADWLINWVIYNLQEPNGKESINLEQ